jgi:hypothetical protein
MFHLSQEGDDETDENSHFSNEIKSAPASLSSTSTMLFTVEQDPSSLNAVCYKNPGGHVSHTVFYITARSRVQSKPVHETGTEITEKNATARDERFVFRMFLKFCSSKSAC